MIYIDIVDIKKIGKEKYELYLSLLPKEIKQEISRYRLKEDRIKRVASKISLLNYLKKYTNSTPKNLKRTSCGKLYIENSNVDFSISYSKDYAICIFAKGNIVGVDIEFIHKDINLNEFKEVFSQDEFDLIQNSKNKIDKFYRLWTIKEAVLKADGRGFLCDPKEICIDIENSKASLQNKMYDLQFYKKNDYIYSIAICSNI